MPDVYSDIALTEEETSSLQEVENEPTSILSDSESESPFESQFSTNWDDYGASDDDGEKSSSNEEFLDSESEEEYDLQIGDETFDVDSVLKWKSDSENKSEWNKSNTLKAQTIAKGGRLLSLIDNDDAFKEHVKEYFYEDEKEIKKYGLDSEFAIDFDKQIEESEKYSDDEEDYEDDYEDNPVITELEDRLDFLEDEKLSRSIGDRYDEIKENNKDFFDEEGDGLEFLNFCNESGVIKDGDIDMEQSFKLWSYDKVMTAENRREQLSQNKMRNDGSTIGNSEIGAKDIRSGDSPKNYNDISLGNPEVSRYFNT